MNSAATPRGDLWRNLHDDFGSLAVEQRALLKAMQQGDRRLRAACSYNWDSTDDERELSQQGRICLVYRLESGVWKLTEGPNESFKARFEALATRAGIALRPPTGIAALDFWLHSLCCYLRRIESKDFFGRSDIGGFVEDVFQDSATFCSWLEKKALEASASTPMQNTKHGKLRASKTGANDDPEVAKRRSLLRANPGVSAQEMCGIFDRERVPLPSKWQEAGLRSWIEANKKPQYRRRIQVLISKDRQTA